jgi:hypothetical protein
MTGSKHDGQVVLYQTQDGKARIEVRFEHENVWLTQKLMSELFECSTDNVSLHLKNVFEQGELDPDSVTEEYSVTAADGKSYKTKHYSLEAIIAVGYRVNSARGTQFRIWATARLKDYILKGFAIDSERFKHGTRFEARYFDELLEEIREIRASERMAYQKIADIYATSIDYSADSAEAEKFFATVQNKLHFAITGKTAAEIIASRADRRKPHMGLTTWRKAPAGKVLPADVAIAKNYLGREELLALNRIVTMYLDYAEVQASRGRPMYMRDWASRLDAFLRFNEHDVLTEPGHVSHAVAAALADKEYAAFRVEQDQSFVSDFDRTVKQLAAASRTPRARSITKRTRKRET